MRSLSDEEKTRVLLQVDHFVDIIEDRTGLTFSEVVEIIKWSKQRKAFHEKLIEGGVLAAVGLIISALLYAVWKGVIEHIRL